MFNSKADVNNKTTTGKESHGLSVGKRFEAFLPKEILEPLEKATWRNSRMLMQETVLKGEVIHWSKSKLRRTLGPWKKKVVTIVSPCCHEILQGHDPENCAQEAHSRSCLLASDARC